MKRGNGRELGLGLGDDIDGGERVEINGGVEVCVRNEISRI